VGWRCESDQPNTRISHAWLKVLAREESAMRIKTLILRDFRGIQELELKFDNAAPTVLIGPNGAGKSSILECLAILLSRLIGRIRSTSGTGRFFSDYDITNGKNETSNELTISLNDKEYSWRVVKTRAGRKKQTITNLKEIQKIADEIQEGLTKDPKTNLPIAVYYPVTRAVLDIPLRIRGRREFDQLASYDNALSSGRQDFRIFFAWFRNQEDIENQEKGRQNYHYKDRQLEAVRNAVYRLVPGFSNLRVERSPLRMAVTKNVEGSESQEVFVNQLSDGEKCLLALVGDLARRLAIANPGRNDALQGRGVVLIDEVDLHLYPAWQRIAVPRLQETFPNCQFIVATHSPQVLSSVKEANVYMLMVLNGSIKAKRFPGPYGKDTNTILEELMEVEERPPEIKERILKYFERIESGELMEAEQLRQALALDIGEDDPELVRGAVLTRRKEILGK
jgi:predicted ATP-binding protein involved in virulence